MNLFKLIVGSIICLYLQVLVAPRLAIFGAEPSFLIPYIIFVGITLSEAPALLIAFFLGMGLDILQPGFFGLNTLSFLLISILVLKIHSNVNKKQVELIAMSIIALNIVYSVIVLLTYLAMVELSLQLTINTSVSTLYNSVVSFLMVYLYVFISKVHLTIYD